MANFLQQAALDIAATRYFTIAAVTVLLYDNFLTLGDEVELIWPAKLGPLKLIYLFNRYVVCSFIAASFSIISGHATFLNHSLCRTWLLTNMCMELVAVQTTAFVVAARVFDIWDSSRTALLVLGPLWIVHCAIDCVIVAQNAIWRAPGFRYEKTFNMCYGDVSDSWTGWLNGIIYHSLILLLLSWLWLSTPRLSQTPLMKLIVRDGFIYFFAILGAMLFNLIIWKEERQTLAALPYWSVWAITTHALLRLLLSMGSIQTPEEWGQHARIRIPKVDIELALLHDPKEITKVAIFSDEEPTHHGTVLTKISTVGRYED